MKLGAIRIGVSLGIVATVSVLTASAVSATGGQGAVVLKGATCNLVQPPLPILTTTRSHSVVTPSGNSNLSCHFQTTRQAQTRSANEIPCFTAIGQTTEARAVVTKSGRGMLSCKLHP